MKLDISNLVCRLNVKDNAITHVKVLQHGVHSGSRDLLKFLEISANISEMVPDRLLHRKTDMKSSLLSTGTSSNDFVCHFSCF